MKSTGWFLSCVIYTELLSDRITFLPRQHSGDSSVPKVSVLCARQCDHHWLTRSLEPAWALGKECPGVSVLEQGNRLCRQGLRTLADSPLSRSQLGTGSVMKSHIRGCVSNNIVKGNGCSHLFSSTCIPEATPEVAPSLSSFVVPMEKICILRKLVKRLD